MTKKGITVYLTEQPKKQLEEMAEETGIPQAQLINLATISMLENYKVKGSFVFVDLLNPEYKQNKKANGVKRSEHKQSQFSYDCQK
jgi:hypothetical protein